MRLQFEPSTEERRLIRHNHRRDLDFAGLVRADRDLVHHDCARDIKWHDVVDDFACRVIDRTPECVAIEHHRAGDHDGELGGI